MPLLRTNIDIRGIAMTKIKLIIFTLALCLVFTGCDNLSKITNVDTSKEVKEIKIFTRPVSKDSSKIINDRDSIDIVIKYLNSLKLKEPKENPDDYEGMSYIIQITYSDDSKKEYYHSGNKFFKEAGSTWREMEYKQAEQFSSIYDNL